MMTYTGAFQLTRSNWNMHWSWLVKRLEGTSKYLGRGAKGDNNERKHGHCPIIGGTRPSCPFPKVCAYGNTCRPM